MTKEELQIKAKEYAVSILDAKINEIAEAYIKGYEDGVKSVPVENPITEEDGIKYYDFGLPSGLLWSEPLQKDGELLMCPYIEASKYRLPTEEEVRELFEICSCTNAYIKGRNGVQMLKGDPWLWLKNDADRNPKDFKCFDWHYISENFFEGDSHAIMVVKHKDEVK